MKKGWFCLGLLLLLSARVQAEVREEVIQYSHDGTALKGYLYYDDRFEGRRPGILVAHEWWGLNDYARKRARMLAELGYVAFAMDMYGQGKVTEHADTAQGWMKQIAGNTDAWLARARAGLMQLQKHPRVNRQRLAAIGYCFGGSTVMQMAYAGLPLKAVVSFHGSLPPATAAQAGQIRAAILAEHGARDAFVPDERVQAFRKALDTAGVDYVLTILANARHAFTNPDAARYGIDNVQYNARADQRSWAQMKDFLEEML